MEAQNCAGLLATAMWEAGVTAIFGYPGDPTIEFMEQSRQRGIEVVLARREGTAGFMAEGAAMATGKLGVAFSTLGPGSSALVNPVAAANLDRVPLLALSGQIDSSQEQYFTHQVIDHKALYSPVTKWAGRLDERSAEIVLRKALRTAVAERPGAVHLTCPADVMTAEVASGEFHVPPLDGPSSTTFSVHATSEARDPLAALAKSRRPVILAGISATRGNATDELVAFAEAFGAPVVVGPMAKGVFPEDHSLFAGTAEVACTPFIREFLASADLIVAVGFDAVELLRPWSAKAPVLHIDSTPNTDQIYPSNCEVVGEISTILEWLTSEWKGEPRWAEADVRKHQADLREAFYAGAVPGSLNPTDVLDAVQASVPRDSIVTTDVGSHKYLVTQGWKAILPRTVLNTNGLSSMGFGVPGAIGAQMAMPDRQVVAMVGDGGFAMAATELRLASHLGLPLICVVLVDGSLNRIELKQITRGYPSTATRIEDMNLVELASALDCDGERVQNTSEIEKVMAQATDLKKPLIIEARIDPAQYLAQF